MSIFLISLINAEISFWQTKEFKGNGTIQNRMVLTYSKGGFGIANDYIVGNNPLETYIQYSIYVQKFNNDNPNYKIDYCNFRIETEKRLENTPVIVFEKNYTSSSVDIFNAQYFIRLDDGDQAFGIQTCYFMDKNFNELLLPADMQMVMPTNKCKACQFYLWTKQEADIYKIESISDNIVLISNYIRKVVLINFEIIIALFWIFLILMLLIGIGFIFILSYWLFLYLYNIGK